MQASKQVNDLRIGLCMFDSGFDWRLFCAEVHRQDFAALRSGYQGSWVGGRQGAPRPGDHASMHSSFLTCSVPSLCPGTTEGTVPSI